MAADDDNCISQSWMPGQTEVTLCGWMFCGAHGLEHCHRCTVDHRMTNNVRLENEVTEAEMEKITDYGLNSLDGRPPLSVGGKFKALPGSAPACVAHSKVGCAACFDFKAQVLKGAR
ncbi:MAG: hypothetical protein J3K34DRAFT_410279 [Monoraphidium minutum]|nr:MAG: hypothetical protein J3K34DRAFT_410279 [Monoraphidium minutum]